MESISIQGSILTNNSGDAYVESLRRNSDLSILPAKYVVQPAVYEDIPPVLAYALNQSSPLEIAVKGGGAHSSTWASSDGGVVIDLSKLNKVTLAADKRSITVQGGALWGDVYEVTSREKVDVVGSPLWFVGVGGFTLGGGYGALSGEHGLAIDNMLSAIVVLADGRIVKTNELEEPELFWAIRGGGGQFGVVVEITFRTHPYSGPFGSGVLAYPGSQFADVLHVIKSWKNTQTPGEKLTVTFTRPAPHFKPSIVILAFVTRDENLSRSKKVLEPFRALNPVLDKIAPVSDLNTVSHAADASLATVPRRLVIRGTMFTDFFPKLLTTVWDHWVAFTEGNDDVKATSVLWDLTHPGIITQVSSDATALKMRTPHYWMAVQGRSTTDASVKAAQDFTASIVTFVREKNAALAGADLGWFLNLCRGDEKPEDVFRDNLPRLRQAKALYDPNTTWKKGVTITPSII